MLVVQGVNLSLRRPYLKINFDRVGQLITGMRPGLVAGVLVNKAGCFWQASVRSEVCMGAAVQGMSRGKTGNRKRGDSQGEWLASTLVTIR